MPELVFATPVLASLDIARTLDFYATKLGFRAVLGDRDDFAIVIRDSVELHFWRCEDPARHWPQLRSLTHGEAGRPLELGDLRRRRGGPDLALGSARSDGGEGAQQHRNPARMTALP